MRIIRHGKYYDPFPLIIRCVCGCEYEADKRDGEITLSEDGSATCFEVYCPECGGLFGMEELPTGGRFSILERGEMD